MSYELNEEALEAMARAIDPKAFLDAWPGCPPDLEKVKRRAAAKETARAAWLAGPGPAAMEALEKATDDLAMTKSPSPTGRGEDPLTLTPDEASMREKIVADLDVAILRINVLTGYGEDAVWRPADAARNAMIAARDALALFPTPNPDLIALVGECKNALVDWADNDPDPRDAKDLIRRLVSAVEGVSEGFGSYSATGEAAPGGATEGWRPIAEAIKGPGYICAAEPYGSRWSFHHAWWNDMEEEWNDAHSDRIVNPTHWMPLPKPPAS